jgi:hypothetical protein
VEHICLPRESQRINPSLKKDVNEIIISMLPRNSEIFFFIKLIPGNKTLLLLLLLLLNRYKINIQETTCNYLDGFVQIKKIK